MTSQKMVCFRLQNAITDINQQLRYSKKQLDRVNHDFYHFADDFDIGLIYVIDHILE
jgi:hypothetical protein